MRLALTTILLTTGCIRVDDLPDVGQCASYPDETYEYGQIGIGTCLAGPNRLHFAGDTTNPTLLVTNANPFKVFSGGSLLAIPWSAVEFDDPSNEVDTLGPVALALPNFAMGLEVDATLGFVGLRESLNARTRFGNDDVFLVDLRDPANPVASTRGTDSGSTVEVLADPVAMAVDTETGLTFVANRSSKSISVLDTTASEVAVIQPWPEALVTAAVFSDETGSGGAARMVEFNTLGSGQLTSDVWTLGWVEGTWRIWVPGDAGLQRYTTQMMRDATGAPLNEASSIENELAIDDAPSDVLELSDAHYTSELQQMLFASEGDLWSASTGDYLGDWSFASTPFLRGESDSWRAILGGPSVTFGVDATHLFFDAAETDEGANGPSVIGTAISTDGVNWTGDTSPILEPQFLHEGDHIADPYVVYDADTQLWRMFYSAYDGETWTIGHATSADLVEWIASDTPVVSHDLGAASPAVHRQLGRWHMWFSTWTGTEWSLAYATSPDGTHWSVADSGIDLVADDPLRPPRATINGAAASTFQVRGEATGFLPEPLVPGYSYAALNYGWSAEILAGAEMDLGDLGPESNGGLHVDAVHTNDAGVATTYWTVANRAGRERIAFQSDNSDSIGIFEGSGTGFDRGGVSHAAPFSIDGEDFMVYAGTRSGRQTIGLARLDGTEWASEGRVFSTSADNWDGVSVVPNRVIETDTGLQMWYSGFDGSRWRVGSARSTDGRSWTRDDAPRGYQFGLGEPGEWDDSGVRDAWVETDEDGEHLWYAGFDGDTWQIGYAIRAPGEASFSRASNPFSGEGRPVVQSDASLFHRTHASRPVVTTAVDGLHMFYAGESGEQSRVGTAFGLDVDRFNRTPRLPRTGDTLTFSTQRGDEDTDAIPLDGFTDGHTTDGTGVADLHVDQERGMLFASSAASSTIFVIDIRDDTDLTAGFIDRNYLDIEAILLLNTTVYATGFRQVMTQPGSDRLLALVDAPESVVQIDISGLVDDEFGDALYNIATGYIAAPRGNERDEGTNTMNSVGPGQMVLHPDGHRLFVSNFNRNSVTAYDLRLGPYGMPIREIRNVGENPYAMAIAPDGNQLVVGNYTGELENRVSHADLGIIDINPESSTYLEAVSWIVNR